MAKITVTESGTTVVIEDGDTVIIDIPGGGDVTIAADPDDGVDKVKIEFVNDSEADTVNIDLSTFSEDDLHIDIKDYDPTDAIHLEGAFNKYVDPDEVDEFTFEYIGADGQTYSGFVHAKDKHEKDFLAEDSPIIICFAEGTKIETIEGPRSIETLRPGDEVLTLDSGFRPVKWLGKTTFQKADLQTWPQLVPIRVKKGALGAGRPEQDILLSPNHRLLISGWRAEIYFGETEVLVPVKSLLDGKSILVEPDCRGVTYCHLLLERHEIVHTQGLLSESLFLGDQTLLAMSALTQLLLRSSFSASEYQRLASMPASRPMVRAFIGRCLAA